jgi:hypothetical protein
MDERAIYEPFLVHYCATPRHLLPAFAVKSLAPPLLRFDDVLDPVSYDSRMQIEILPDAERVS